MTNDIERRFAEHQANSSKTAKYLRGKQPLHMAWHYQVDDKRQALILERKIKSLTKQQKETLCKTNQFPHDFIARSANGTKCDDL